MSTATAETDHDQHPEPEVEVVEDLDQWLLENTIEPVVCDTCGGLERWEDLAGNWHCTDCDPPLTAARLRERAARLRRDVATIQQAAKARRVVA